MERTYVLRMYVRPKQNGGYLGVCLKPYLAVEGREVDETLQKLRSLLSAYVDDAVRDGDVEAAMRRGAPWKLRFDYGAIALAILIHNRTTEAMAVSESRPIRLQHA